VIQLQKECEDPLEITQRILPLFDEILRKRLNDHRSEAMEILADHIAEILARSSAEDSVQLGEALKQVIAPAISREIEENRDRMVDALYPIMGGMIARYVSNAIQELREKIDRKIEEGFSLQAIQRKLKARLSGVSESELILEEEIRAGIKAIFIVQKKSGLLIAESSWREGEFEDPHLVASMASAIKDFIEEWIREQEEASEVQLVSYGNATLYIENAGTVYLIAFLDREPDHEQRDEIHRFFAGILSRHFKFFQHFEGDDSDPEIEILQEELNRFIAAESEERHHPPQKVSGFSASKGLAILFIGMMLYLLWSWIEPKYRLYRLENALKEKSGYSLPMEYEKGRIVVGGVLPDLAIYRQASYVLKELLPQGYIDKIHLPASIWFRSLQRLEKLDQNLSRILQENQSREQNTDRKIKQLKEMIEKSLKTDRKYREELSTMMQKNQGLQEHIEKYRERLKSLRSLAELKKVLGHRLTAVFRGSVYFDPKTFSLDFRTGDFFAPGQSEPRAETLKVIDKDAEKYISILLGNRAIRPYVKSIIIEGHTDSRGDPLRNLQLSKMRAEVVRRHLLAQPWAKRYHLSDLLRAVGVGSRDPIMHNGKEDYEASRRIRLRFELNEKKILDSIEKGLE